MDIFYYLFMYVHDDGALTSGIRLECVAAMTNLENNTLKLHGKKCDYKKFYGNMRS